MSSLNVGIVYNGPIKPIGGPSGYLYNLKASIELNKLTNITLISPKTSDAPPPLSNPKEVLKKYIPFVILTMIKFLLYFKFYLSIKKEIQNQKILHFHSTTDLFFLSFFIDLKRFKIALTSHSPEPFCNEVKAIAESSGYSSFKARQMFSFQKKCDVFSFSKTDYIIFPCEGAVDPYRSFFKKNEITTSKIRYVLTSSQPLIPKQSKEEFISRYNLDRKKFIIAYVGRKNHIKGYDIFCEIYKKSNNNNHFFISAGTGAIEPTPSSNFLDIGWTNDPGSVINTADLILIPNRDTYFDIGMIQALSLNKPILTTLTGGNKWFEGKSNNIFFFNPDNVDSALELIESISSNRNYSNENLEIYKKYLSNDDSAQNFNVFYKRLIS